MSQIPPVSGLPPVANMNPYAAPALPAQLIETQPGFEGLWRQGNVLIMHKAAPLPPICVKSNEKAEMFLRRNLQWHPQWIAVTILAGLLVYVILALIMTKRATINIGLTNEWASRRKTRMLIAVLIALFTMGTGIASIAVGGNSQELELLIPLGVLMLVFGPIIALIYGQFSCRLVYPSQITDTHVWLKGVHPGFLDRLPAWPYR